MCIIRAYKYSESVSWDQDLLKLCEIESCVTNERYGTTNATSNINITTTRRSIKETCEIT